MSKIVFRPHAIKYIVRRLDVSVGKAQKILLDACASGEVRYSTVRLFDTIYQPDWPDLQYWLDEHYPAKPKSAEPKSKKPAALREAELTKWARQNVNPEQPASHWYQAAKDAHPARRIPRDLWRRVRKKLPDSQKRPRGKVTGR